MEIICVHTIVRWATPWLGIRMFLFKAPDSFLLPEEYLVFWSPSNSLDSVLPMSFHLHGQRRDNAAGGGNGVALWLITSNSQMLLFGSHIIQNHLMSFPHQKPGDPCAEQPDRLLEGGGITQDSPALFPRASRSKEAAFWGQIVRVGGQLWGVPSACAPPHFTSVHASSLDRLQ